MSHLRPEPAPVRPDLPALEPPVSPDTPPVTLASPTPRLLGLDALRGLAILLMCLSGLLPKFLPNEMYHGYTPSYLPQPAMTVDGQPAVDAVGEAPLIWQAVENPWRFRGVEWPSFTWVDWVFPGFLFAMGAAIPLAYTRRLAKGASPWALVGSACWRFVILLGFAVYVKQMSPGHQASGPDASVALAEYWTALVGLLLLLPVLARLPKTTPRGLGWAIRLLGVGGAIAFLAMVNDRPTNPPFSWSPSTGDADIIIVLLAWSSLVAALLWLLTRGGGWWGWSVRLVLGLGVAFVAHDQGIRGDWRLFGDALKPIGDALQMPKQWLDLSGLGGPDGVLPGHLPEGVLNLGVLYDFTWLKFLWVVVPGTIVGDILVRYLDERRALRATSGAARTVTAGIAQSKVAAEVSLKANGESVWGLSRHILVSVSLLLCIVAVFVGLKDYAGTFATIGPVELATPYAAVLLGLPPLVVALLAMQAKPGCHGRALRRLTLWGTAWLTGGLVLAVLPDPRVVAAADAEVWATFGAGYFEGGIGKGPPARLSWYLTALGVSVLLLVVLMVWSDVRGWHWPFGWLIANGQNPMLAYAMLAGPLAAVVSLPWLMPVVGGDTPSNLEALVRSWITELYGPDASPWHDAGWDVAKTLGLAAVVWIATRRGIVLRS
ncbi:MAG: DUF5009 domain-containing protein [Planctomycetota bacterium]